MRRLLLAVLLWLGGCHARTGWERYVLSDPGWERAPANRSVRALFGWAPPAVSPAWARCSVPGLIPDAPYGYDPERDVFVIPLPDGGVLWLRGDPETPPPAARPTEAALDDADAAYRWAFGRPRPELPAPRGGAGR